MFFERLTEACKRRNITVTALCKELNVATANGTFWKNGSIPKGELLIRISDYLGVSIDYLLGRTSNPALNVIEKTSPQEWKEVLDVYFMQKIGRRPTLEELSRLNDFTDTFIEGMNKG